MSKPEQTINSFQLGVNSDLAKTVYKEGNYLKGLNITLLTDNGLSTAVVQNKKGNKLQIEFPSIIPQTTYETNGEYPITVPAQESFIPIGGIEINNVCFVFTTSNTVGDTNDKGYGQIWRFNFLLNDDISGATGGTLLTVNGHLMYNRFLNFDLNFRPKIVGKYENQNFARLYWADNNRNPLRTINTIGPLSTIIETPVRSLDIVSEANLDTPVISKLITGDLPEGKYQVAYRLLSKAGVLTKFSTCSNLIDVIEGDEYNSELDYPRSNTIEYSTDKEATIDTKELKSSQKGIEFYIDKVDKDYQMIQYVLIYYSEPDIPEIYVFPYKEISLYENLNDNLTQLYDDTFLLNLDEFKIIYSPFERVKTLDIKENTLYVANTTNTEFKVNTDYRAYRFNQEGQSTIYELDNTTNTFTESNYPVSTLLDAINPYNDDSGTIFGLNPSGTPEDWFNNQQYKYQSDGVTPGGSGPNIQYTFGTTQLVVDTNSDSKANKPPFIKTEVDYSNLIEAVPNHIVNNNGSFSSLKSPYKANCQVSWQRGEVYRFGITFYNKKGQASYVNWIGDIKMPDFNEFGASYSLLSTYNSGKLYMYSTNVEFDVTIPQDLAEEISGFRIVYVQRKQKDKTRFGTGVTGGFEEFNKPPLTTSKDVAIAAICMFVDSILRRTIDNLVGGTAAGEFDPFGIKDKIADAIVLSVNKFLIDKLNSSSSNLQRMLNPEYIAEMVASILEGVVNKKPGLISGLVGGNLIKLFGPRIIDLVKELVIEQAEDAFTRKIAGLHQNVLSLGKGFAYSNINSSYGSGSGTVGYIISPIIDFETYKYRQGDFIRPLSYFGTNNKLVNEIHRDTTVGIYNPIDSSAYIRKWYSGNNFTWNQVADKATRRINIKNQKVLKAGELLGSGFDSILTYAPNSTDLDFIISNSYVNKIPKVDASGNIIDSLNTQLINDLDQLLNTDAGLAFDITAVTSFVAQMGKAEKVLGIGDKKHLFFTDVEFGENGVPRIDGAGIADDESNSFNLVSNQAVECIRNVDYRGDYTVSYNRPNSRNQYNGIGYTSRANNTYIAASEFYSLTTREGDKSFNIKATLGDTYVGAYGAVNYCYYYDQIKPDGYQRSIRTKKGLYEIFPCEADFNFTLREGQHVINNLSPDELEETTEFKVDEKRRPVRKFFRNLKEKITKVKLEPAKDVLRTKRFLLSDFEFNEVFNQRYNINTYVPQSLLYEIEVDEYTNRIWHSKRKIDGEVIDSWRDFQLVDYLDVEGTQGPIVEILVNKNKLFYYQTNGIGVASTNERGAVNSGDGEVVLSNGKLLSRYDYLTKETGSTGQFGIVNTNKAIYHYDGTLKKLFKLSEGLECISDNLGWFSRLQQTTNSMNKFDQTLNGLGVHGIYDIEYQTVYFSFLDSDIENNFTLGYNEKSDAFEGDYSFKPNLYFKLDNKLFSSNQESCWWHNKGNYGSFYGEIYPSSLTILTNPNPLQTKTWGNQQFKIELYDTNNNLINLETIDQIRHRTENQDTGLINLIPQTNIVKKERDWKVAIQKDINNSTYSTLSKPRLRDMYLETDIIYNNENGYRLVLQPIITFYRQSIH